MELLPSANDFKAWVKSCRVFWKWTVSNCPIASTIGIEYEPVTALWALKIVAAHGRHIHKYSLSMQKYVHLASTYSLAILHGQAQY